MRKSDQELYNDCLAYAVRLVEKMEIHRLKTQDIGDSVVILTNRFYENIRYKNRDL